MTQPLVFIIEDDVVNMAVYGAVLKRSGATVFRDYWNTDSITMLTMALPGLLRPRQRYSA